MNLSSWETPEFHSVELASWLKSKKLLFVLRQKKDTYIQLKGHPYQRLDSFEIVPGMKRFLTGLKVRKVKGFGQGAIAIYWKRKFIMHEGSRASTDRLTRLVLLIAIAYTFSTFKGQSIRWHRQQEYIGRLRKVKQTLTKNSNFWIGLYGDVWIISQPFLSNWLEELIRLNPNKLPFYHKGLSAMNIIQQAL